MRVCLASRHSQQLCMRQQVCKSTPDERRLEPCNTCARRFNTEKGHSLCKVMNTNNKEAPMHDAFMPFGIRTTSDHSSDQGSPPVLMSSNVLQVTPHIVGLISGVLGHEL